MKPSSWDKQLGLASPRESAVSQSDQTNTPSKNEVRNEVGLDVSHHAPHLSEGRGEPFFLDILFHRMSVIAIYQHLLKVDLSRAFSSQLAFSQFNPW